jgi:hypothetical protein
MQEKREHSMPFVLTLLSHPKGDAHQYHLQGSEAQDFLEIVAARCGGFQGV